MTEADGRAAIVREAREWIDTPYHPAGRIKGVGVDCGTLIAEVYAGAGVIPPMDIRSYPADWHKHKKDEMYLGYILQHGHEVSEGKPGDVATWRFGLVRSHGAIIVKWPLVIHATLLEGKVWECDASDYAEYSTRKPTFYSVW